MKSSPLFTATHERHGFHCWLPPFPVQVMNVSRYIYLDGMVIRLVSGGLVILKLTRRAWNYFISPGGGSCDAIRTAGGSVVLNLAQFPWPSTVVIGIQGEG